MSDPVNRDNLAKIDWEKIEQHRKERCLPEHHARTILSNNLPRVLPANWQELERGSDGRKYGRADGMTFIVSVAKEDDDKEWLHFSVAHPSRMISYDELVEVKELFCGRDNKAIFILPPRAQHINVHSNCLHFFRCLSDDGLPDFTGGTNSL